MCHPNAPTKTHACFGWVQATPLTNPRMPTQTSPGVLLSANVQSPAHLFPPNGCRYISMLTDIISLSFCVNRRQLAPFVCPSTSTDPCACGISSDVDWIQTSISAAANCLNYHAHRYQKKNSLHMSNSVQFQWPSNRVTCCQKAQRTGLAMSTGCMHMPRDVSRFLCPVKRYPSLI